MLSERQLSRSHTSLWSYCAPRLNAKLVNSIELLQTAQNSVKRWDCPLETAITPQHNDLIAEVAFGIFNYLVEHNTNDIHSIDHISMEKIILHAIYQMSIIRKGTGFPRECFTLGHTADSSLLAHRLYKELKKYKGTPKVHYRLNGLGLLASCHPDIIIDKQLLEVKMSRYSFRAEDLRQLILYATLAWFNGIKLEILTLINPRLGITWQFSVQELAFLVSNDTPTVLYQKLEEYLTGESKSRDD